MRRASALLVFFFLLMALVGNAGARSPENISAWYNDGCAGENFCISTDREFYGPHATVIGRITNQDAPENQLRLGFFAETGAPLVFKSLAFWEEEDKNRQVIQGQDFSTSNYTSFIDANGGTGHYENVTGSQLPCSLTGDQCTYTRNVFVNEAFVWADWVEKEVKDVFVGQGTIPVRFEKKRGWTIPAVPTEKTRYFKAIVEAPASFSVFREWEFWVRAEDPFTGKWGELDPTIATGDYGQFRNIQIDMNASLTEDLNEFPMVYAPLTGDVNIGFDTAAEVTGSQMQADCQDFEIAASDTNDESLRWEWENKASSTHGCNTANSIIWVLSDLPRGTPDDSNITPRYYYNRASDSSDDNSDIGTWGFDANLEVVFHFGEENCTSGQNNCYIKNSVDPDINGEAIGTTQGPQDSHGFFGRALNFKSAHFNRVLLSDHVFDSNSLTWTVSFWAKRDSTGGGAPFVAVRNDAGGVGADSGFRIDTTGGDAIRMVIDTGSGEQIVNGSNALDRNAWHHIAARVYPAGSNTQVELWLNGAIDANAAATGTLVFAAGSNTCIGARDAPNSGDCTDGQTDAVIDEVRIWTKSVDLNWLAAEYQFGVNRYAAIQAEQSNTNAPDHVDIAGPVPASGGDGNYLNDNNFVIAFDVRDADAGNVLNVDINYATSAGGAGTGTVIDSNIVLDTDGRVWCEDTNMVDITRCNFLWDASGLSDNNYFVRVNLFDSAARDQNIFQDGNRSFAIDRTAPETAITGFTHDIWGNTASASITLTCSDNLSGCTGGSSLTRYREDTDDSSTVSMGAWTTYSAAFSISGDGNFRLDVNSTDRAGNSKTGFDSNNYVVDTSAPTTTINDFNNWAPGGGNTEWASTDQNLEFTCTDANATAQTSGCNIERYRSDTETGPTESMGAWTDWNSGAEFLSTTDGNFRFDFNSTDLAGNIEDTNTLYVLIDNTAPTATHTQPINGGDLGSQDIVFSIADPGAGVLDANVFIDGARSTLFNTAADCTRDADNNLDNCSYTESNLLTTTGIYTLRVQSDDNASPLNDANSSVVFQFTGAAETTSGGAGGGGVPGEPQEKAKIFPLSIITPKDGFLKIQVARGGIHIPTISIQNTGDTPLFNVAMTVSENLEGVVEVISFTPDLDAQEVRDITLNVTVPLEQTAVLQGDLIITADPNFEKRVPITIEPVTTPETQLREIVAPVKGVLERPTGLPGVNVGLGAGALTILGAAALFTVRGASAVAAAQAGGVGVFVGVAIIAMAVL